MRVRLILAIVCLALSSPAFASAAQNDQLVRAREALFTGSDLDAARSAAAAVMKNNPANADALFILMETAALQADTATELDAALRLCESKSNSVRVNIAAARILDLAANTPEFRAVLPRIRALLADYTPQASSLRAALLAAAADGVPGLDLLQIARDSGLVTDWRIIGPFGRLENVDFERRWPPELDGLVEASYAPGAVERFRFEDGNVNLPDYLHRGGVFYAASDINLPVPGAWLLRVESPGTLEVFLDGANVLLNDARFRVGPEVVSRTLTLQAGTHHVVVKFIPAGTPFRLAVLPAREHMKVAALDTGSEAEATYIAAAEKYWTGNYEGTITELEPLRQGKLTAIGNYLLAQAWSHVAQDSPEQAALLDSALKLAPGALAAEYDLAARAYSDDRIEVALTRARRLVAARPDFAAAEELMSQIAARLNWRAEATDAMEARLRLHPSCSALREAEKFFSASTQYEKARQAEARLQGCAPGSLAYAEALGESGHHADAAQAAIRAVAEHPFSREAHALLVRELALAGRIEAARGAARELTALAPNSETYRRIAAAAETGGILDEDSPRSRHFAARPFYQPYRRNAFQILKDTSGRQFSGGPAVTLLYDRVAKLGADGTAAAYVHKLTRVLNRDGIERYGEVALPDGATLLELRTIKPDGSTDEPEPTRHKATTSMPALAPGDVIEQEYVQWFRDGMEEHPQAFQFVFGSFAAPTIYSRFVVLWPTAQARRMQVVASGAIPQAVTRTDQDVTATVWEQNDIPQSTEEGSMPSSGTLPSVRILDANGGWPEIRDRYRDAVIAATRIGSRAEQAVAGLRGRTDEEKAHEIYRLIVSQVRASGASLGSSEAAGAAAGAEDTLASHAGNRTAALLALARAAALRADLLLARDVGTPRPEVVQPALYTHPLVRFRLAVPGNGYKEVVADADTEGMAFGGLPPTIQRQDALLVPTDATPELAQNPIVSLPDNFASEQSVADGDVTLNESGALEAHISIRMGATRAAQMRSILASIESSQRQHFFEQLALRIFSSAGSATGEVRNEYDLEQPLQIVLTCRASRFTNLASGVTDIDQLVPALGLRKMYGTGTRRFPLYIDAPLFETATFRLHLPTGTAIVGLPADLVLETDFGEYSVTFRQTGDHELQIRRAFRVPVQVVQPERFAAFSQFSLQIDGAERQRITLERNRNSALSAGN